MKKKETDRERGEGERRLKTKNHHPTSFVDLCYHFSCFTLFQNGGRERRRMRRRGLSRKKKEKEKRRKSGFFFFAVVDLVFLSLSAPFSQPLSSLFWIFLSSLFFFFFFQLSQKGIRNQNKNEKRFCFLSLARSLFSLVSLSFSFIPISPPSKQRPLRLNASLSLLF